MGDHSAILDRFEIESLRGEYTDAGMTRNPDHLASLFTPDGALCMPHIDVELVGHDAIRSVGRLQGLWEFFVQNTHPGTVEVDGDTATGRAYIAEIGRLRDGTSHQNFAIYHDRYERTETGWKFTERVYEILYVDTSPLAGGPPNPPGPHTATSDPPRR